MDVPLSSPAVWSQNTEVLVKRWLIFPNGTVYWKQDFGHHVFISLDQSPHYLRLGNRWFVIKQRVEAFWASVNCLKSIRKGKIMASQLPRIHREIIKAGVWSQAPLRPSTPVDGEQQPAATVGVNTQRQTWPFFASLRDTIWLQGLKPFGECHSLKAEDRVLVPLGVRYISLKRSSDLTLCPGYGEDGRERSRACEALIEWGRQIINIYHIMKNKHFEAFCLLRIRRIWPTLGGLS